LVTPLANSAEPLDVARGYLALFPFPTLYIADLDGIEGKGVQLDLVRRLAAALPGVTLWVDNGAQCQAEVAALLEIERTIAVVGSEGGIGPAALDALTLRHGPRIALSLDFKGDKFLGDQRLLASRTSWPDKVIAMTLAEVGSRNGPDLTRLGQVAAAAGLHKVYAAGGIRDRADLEEARKAGAHGALIATAIHNGQIKAGDLD
jgi:phosphoribosylformimino-5-aminoimidazole carboxamide ribotide isomerase